MTAAHLSASPTAPDDRLLASFITLGFVSLAAFAVLHHGMWRDELQAWIAARGGAGAGLSPSAPMQAFNLVVAVTGVYVFTRYSPFTPLQKVLFALGYFPAYQYAAISGDYALGLLGVWICCTLASGPRAGAQRGRAWLLPALWAVALMAALVHLWPAPASDATGSLGRSDRLADVLQAIPAALLPFRDTSQPVRIGLDVLGYVLVGVIAVGLAARRRALAFFLLATAGLLALFYWSPVEGLSQAGYLYVVVIAALWLGTSETGSPEVGGHLVSRAWRFAHGSGLTLLLLGQAIAGLRAIELDRRHVVSNARQAAEFLSSSRLAKYPVIWNQLGLRTLSDSQVVARADSIARVQDDSVVVLVGRPLIARTAGVAPVARVAAFTGATRRDRDFYVYVVSPGGAGVSTGSR